MKKTIHDLSTGEIYEVDLTPEEIELANIEAEKHIELKAEIEAKTLAKLSAQAKLTALGLTIEDLTALGL